MTGTLINVALVVVGSLLGMLIGARLSEDLKRSVISVLGLFCLGFGIKLFIETQNSMVVVTSLLIGVLLGEWWQIEKGIQNLGVWLEHRLNRSHESGSDGSRFVKGFFVSSLLFCVGPMAILGSIQDGLTGDYQTLAIKAILDGFASLAFASSLGLGVMFSAGPIFIYQGAITLLAAQVNALVTETMMVEITAVGGVLLMGIAVSNLLEIRQIRVGNFLPALLAAPFMVLVFQHFGLY
ncbi:MAG TPA: DUF554 domain-containing protein [Chloroflexi bacterium]|nr:DUF554 domain-containing protein [Chloroflexota bacterium]HPO57349.1 DUF554 domain-containing protein [Anaerolineaceae bacterium]